MLELPSTANDGVGWFVLYNDSTQEYTPPYDRYDAGGYSTVRAVSVQYAVDKTKLLRILEEIKGKRYIVLPNAPLQAKIKTVLEF